MLFMLAIAGGVLAILVWAYLLLARGGFWRVQRLIVTAVIDIPVPGPIAVIIPARNEADVIAGSIRSLLNQSCASHLHILLVDDGSTDATVQTAREAAANAAALSVIPCPPLPPGWSGKLWAVRHGIEAARSLHPAFFLLTDADIRHAPDNVARLVAIAERGGYDLTSFMVKLHCASLAEKLLIPAFVFFFLKLYPPAWIADARHRTGGAAGGCILLRPAALERAGGIEAIRSEVIDDCALARAVKRTGGRLWLSLTTSASSTRSYGSFAEIGRMIARTAFNQLRHSVLLLTAALIALAITYLLPILLLFSGQPLRMVLGAAAWLMMSACYLPMVRFYGLRAAWALLLPLAAIFYMGATVVSAVKFWSGRGGEWKGRAQDTGNRAAVGQKKANQRAVRRGP